MVDIGRAEKSENGKPNLGENLVLTSSGPRLPPDYTNWGAEMVHRAMHALTLPDIFDLLYTSPS